MSRDKLEAVAGLMMGLFLIASSVAATLWVLVLVGGCK